MAKAKAQKDQRSPLTIKQQNLYFLQNKLPKLLDVSSVRTRNLEDDYVIPVIRLVSKNGEKHQIELKDIFSPFVDQPAAGWILAEGDVGMGKTTIFMQALPHGWSKGELFNDKFDYIFKIKLPLLFGDWRVNGGYSADELEEAPLKCFIHYLLKEEIADLPKESRVKKPKYLMLSLQRFKTRFYY